MDRRKFFYASALGIGSSFLGPFAWADEADELPKVLLLGDSISIGYHPFVVEFLEGKAHVSRPMFEDGKPENCQGTTHGRKHIDRWIGNTSWDLIHFNFGLHDLKHVDPVTGKNSQDPNHPRQAEPLQYEQNLEQLTRRLKATGAQLMFATTTPYPKELSGPRRTYGDAEIYNEIALKIMTQNDVPVNDLYAFVLPQMEALQRPNNVHFTEGGSGALGKEVAEKASALLKG